MVCDDHGRPRVVHEVVGWDGFVDLAFDEIRSYGAGSIQVARRLLAALRELDALVPPDRRPALARQLTLLRHAVVRAFDDPNERAFALDPDEVGVGGDA